MIIKTRLQREIKPYRQAFRHEEDIFSQLPPIERTPRPKRFDIERD